MAMTRSKMLPPPYYTYMEGEVGASPGFTPNELRSNSIGDLISDLRKPLRSTCIGDTSSVLRKGYRSFNVGDGSFIQFRGGC